jgi:glycosyltransferase involved in cell wall biosynthesis
MPALSVLVPVRNAMPWLGTSLRSLWRQAFRDFEVVAVDDGSTDGSGEALDRAARREPRLRVVHTAARGLPLALNEGLRHARAPLIGRHDADDISHRDRFARQLDTLRRRCSTGGDSITPAPRVATRATGASDSWLSSGKRSSVACFASARPSPWSASAKASSAASPCSNAAVV